MILQVAKRIANIRFDYSMYSRNLSVLDFVRRFFVSCAQISEAYAVRTLMKFGCNWRKIGHKGKCRKGSESTFQRIGGTRMFYGREAERKKLHTMFHSDGQMILRQNTSQKFSKRSASSI